MYSQVDQQLTRLINAGLAPLLRGGGIGLEKECLRVSTEGKLSQGPHPAALGSALTNPYITTDYSEALIEFITPPFTDIQDALDFLADTQTFVYRHLENNEILWATSMPCVVAGETSIPIARYGSSNAGMMKTVYRRGLGYRYGRVMQVIAGVHFNFSFPEALWPALQALERDTSPLQDYITTRYFATIRNLLRLGWLVPYLFGASAAVCKSFLGDKAGSLSEFNENSFYEPFATSLRMGDIGYQNNKENEIGIKANYDSVDAYVDSLTCAITTPYPGYEKIGVVVDGEYRQLNANILQIENEYYSTVRPKQILHANEKPTLALKRRGVRYLELRSIDVNAYDPLGINAEQMRFLEAFMLLCLLDDSPAISADERIAIDANEIATAHRGRMPGLLLRRQGKDVKLKTWALAVCDALQGICEMLDTGHPDKPYTQSLTNQRESVLDPDRTPSARMLADMREHGEGFYHFAKRMSQTHYEYFMSRRLNEAREQLLKDEAELSQRKQQALEEADKLSFDEYLRQYFAQSMDDTPAPW